MIDKILGFMITTAFIFMFIGLPIGFYNDFRVTDKMCQKKYKDKDDYEYCMAKSHIIVDK